MTRDAIPQQTTLDGRMLAVRAPEIIRELLSLYSKDEIIAFLLTKVNEGDPRLSDARTPLHHTHPAADLDLSDKAGLGLDLTGDPNASTVSGLLGQALPASVRDGFLKRNNQNTAWEEEDDVAERTQLEALQDDFNKLLLWVVENFGVVPEGLEEAFEKANV